MERTTRRSLLAAGTAGAIGVLAGCVGSLGGDGGDGNSDEPVEPGTWYTAELTDVRTGETFTVADLPTPLLVETFAVWCSKCFRQQEALRTFHERNPNVPSVALNVDPNEDAERVRRHAERNGFDWRYAVSPPAVTDGLVSQFGSSMTTPPRVPKVRVCESGVTRLDDGVKSADWLADAVDDCPSA
jgi:hypothetical protein